MNLLGLTGAHAHRAFLLRIAQVLSLRRAAPTTSTLREVQMSARDVEFAVSGAGEHAASLGGGHIHLVCLGTPRRTDAGEAKMTRTGELFTADAHTAYQSRKLGGTL